MNKVSKLLQPIALSICLFSFAFLQTLHAKESFPILEGSGMTNEEEALALSQDENASFFIKQASQGYLSFLTQYKEGSITWDKLKNSHCRLFKFQLSLTKGEIESSQGDIRLIANDYDEDHEAGFTQHVQTLIGIAQKDLGISAGLVFMPPLPSDDSTYPNLVTGGDLPSSENWPLSYGSGALVSGTITTDSSNGASFSQTVTTTPSKWYLISGDINGASQGDGNVFSGEINVTGANKDFPQATNELDEGGLIRRYFWVQAEDTSMTISLSGTHALNSETGPFFQNISVRDLNIDCSTEEGQAAAMALAEIISPPISTTGSPDVGWYPQIEKKLANGDNLIDGTISIMKNVDMTALGDAGHPYWYFDKENPVSSSIQIINGLNGANGLILPAGADPTTNGPVPIPNGDYTVTCNIYVPTGATGSVRITFAGTNLNDGSQLDKLYQDFTNLSPGENTITLTVPKSTFSDTGIFFRPAITFENKGSSSINLYNAALIPSSNDTYTAINSINPYNSDRSWYSSSKYDVTYDFTSGDISYDWGIALTGNTMFSATPKDVSVTDQGIILASNSQGNGVFDGGGIQSTQLIDPMKDFSISVTFAALDNTSNYEPTFAIWTYGESQRGPNDPLTHRNGSGADQITEFDNEMGSDPNDGQRPAPSSKMYMRPGSYIGHAAGGHSEILPSGAEWPLIPNIWKKASKKTNEYYTLTMSGTWTNGSLTLSRSIENVKTGSVTTIDSQDLGKGPFSPMYIKIAMENPSWNAESQTKGSASVAVQKISISQGTDIPENVPRKIPLSKIDYTWFTPGGGGGISYTPFLPRGS